MLGKIVNRLPRDLLVYVYKRIPFQGFKDWIVYRSQHRFLVGVVGIFTNASGQVLLLHHDYRNKPWGIPGGWMEKEQPEAALLREVTEETGLQVEITGLARAAYVQSPNRIDLIYRGRVIGGTFQPCSEISAIRYCDIGDWPDGMPRVQKELIQDILSGE